MWVIVANWLQLSCIQRPNPFLSDWQMIRKRSDWNWWSDPFQSLVDQGSVSVWPLLLKPLHCMYLIIAPVVKTRHWWTVLYMLYVYFNVTVTVTFLSAVYFLPVISSVTLKFDDKFTIFYEGGTSRLWLGKDCIFTSTCCDIGGTVAWR